MAKDLDMTFARRHINHHSSLYGSTHSHEPADMCLSMEPKLIRQYEYIKEQIYGYPVCPARAQRLRFLAVELFYLDLFYCTIFNLQIIMQSRRRLYSWSQKGMLSGNLTKIPEITDITIVANLGKRKGYVRNENSRV